jgi:hypothetical protein
MFERKTDCSFEYGKNYTVYVMDENNTILVTDEINATKDDGNIKLDSIIKSAKKKLKKSKSDKLTLVVTEEWSNYTIKVYNKDTDEMESLRADNEITKNIILNNISNFTDVYGEIKYTKDTTVKTTLIMKF